MNILDKMLWNLEKRDFQIHQLMNLESIHNKYPHISDKQVYEEEDALSAMITFIISDLVEHFGFDINH